MDQQPNTQKPLQLPPNFMEVASSVEGIHVFAPRPVAPKEETPTTYNCPNCGAATRYDVSAGGVACEYCGYTAPVKSAQVGQRAEKFEFTLETFRQAEKGWGVSRKELHCDNCGAALSIEEGVLSTTCPFCSSNKVNITTTPADQLRPRYLIPFKIKPEAIPAKAQEWLGKGWFHPSELSKSSNLDKFYGIYLPFWTFSAEITSNWKAEVGHERQERYYDAGDKSWKTRTVIDWRWENGQVTNNINDLLVTGSTHISRLILERVYPYNMNDLVNYSPDFLAGWQAQAYDVTLPVSWEQAKEIMRERCKKACHDDIHSSHVRNFSMTADFADETWRYLLLPVYLAAYKFEEKVYQVMVNGQTGVVAGQKPVAWWKIWLAIAALLLPGLISGAIGLPLLLAGGIGVFPMILGFILLVAGGILSFKLYRQAIDSEAS